ncbi:PH domain-containing protein [Longispora sp. K20-0274]|uniref:PH domain-containing protein n=1 Tax=Longispora sp. K20-0274 TaxID=3088255 RepID=UPI00399A11D9
MTAPLASDGRSRHPRRALPWVAGRPGRVRRSAVEVLARPWHLRLVCRTAGVGIGGLCLLGAFYLAGYDRDTVPVPGVAVLSSAAVLALAVGHVGGRPRVLVDSAGVRVVNLVGRRLVPWARIRAVRHDAGQRCARLETVTGERLAMHAIRRSDHQYAADAVHRLAELVTARGARG